MRTGSDSVSCLLRLFGTLFTSRGELNEDSMNTTFIFYGACFGVGLIFTLVSAILGEVFGGHHGDGVDGADVGAGGHADAGFEHTGLPGLGPFSPTVIASFITALGGFGMILTSIEMTKPIWISLPLWVLGGLLIAVGVFLAFNALFARTQGTSESRVGELIGHSATIITPIPANGVGEIAYVHGGSRYTAPARDDRGAPVAAGQTVKIVRIVGAQFYVQAN
jgi:membrane protein implicated in regulation of membrane protease activity